MALLEDILRAPKTKTKTKITRRRRPIKSGHQDKRRHTLARRTSAVISKRTDPGDGDAFKGKTLGGVSVTQRHPTTEIFIDGSLRHWQRPFDGQCTRETWSLVSTRPAVCVAGVVRIIHVGAT